MTDLNGSAADRVLTKEALVERLELDLLSTGPPPGTKLEPERRLAERFGVSRPMVREALRALEALGMIEVLPGRGAFVRDVRLADAVRPLDTFVRRRKPTPRDLVQARRTLESETASLAAANADEDDLALMESALQRFDAATDLVSRARADVAFHAAVARASHNPVIETMFASITTLVFEQMLRSLGDPSVSREGIPYHHEVLDAIRARDPQAARAAMEGHLLVALRTYGKDLDRSLDFIAQRTIEQMLHE
ncbi:FadR family transcriptional regulator [Actinoallomurus purpureus]|uniref:FadR/GntR family transcriptional regulator n=1 Tax=Actinoallomurus purpureus TaxID=478114 RepID=UPI00209231A0|nr:FadR/GntR family transcriptional regulator [Actinoallomurus purpureus]MCO6004212.1 FadR family transcriptional regulator [Actinoallomurus purpureus]